MRFVGLKATAPKAAVKTPRKKKGGDKNENA